MTSETAISPGRVIGIGGVFLKSPDAERSRSWYRENLGIPAGPDGSAMFEWRTAEETPVDHLTVWSIFPQSSNYFNPSPSTFMINYIVDDLNAILAKLKDGGVKIDPKQEDFEYGRFAWIYDLDGNKIELWEPAKAK
jgi:predicted enzyme related to lactoylglutathione lyase